MRRAVQRSASRCCTRGPTGSVGFAYTVGRTTVALDATAPRVRTEEHGLPIHGLLAAYDGWEVVGARERSLSAEADLGADPSVLDAFPFPHRLRLDVELEPGRLVVTTTLTPYGSRAVPVAFGFHPYFALPDTPRDQAVLAHGPMTRLLLDERGLPTGGREPVAARDAPLGDDTYDDLFGDLGEAPWFSLTGHRRRVTVRLLEGYTHLQLFAPPDAPSVAIEPMTAPTDALRTGEDLRVVTTPFTAAFAIEVEAIDQ